MNLHRLTRKTHRYLGLLIGIQFLAWTLGGLYFSWTSLDKVHGSDLIGPAPELDEAFVRVPVESAIAALPDGRETPLERIDFVTFSESAALYRIQYSSPEGRASLLVDAATGEPREGLSREEAEALARYRYKGTGALLETTFLETTDPHDEYRELPLPAYAFRFSDDRGTTLYIAPDHGRLTSVRNANWRIFDFLWMLHTMDYQGRDNFNNLLLRAFSILGLATIASGFLLFVLSSPAIRRRIRK